MNELVMLVDDDDAAHTYHRIMMKEAGWHDERIISKYNVDEAIEYIGKQLEQPVQEKWPKFIFVDLNMPAKSGYDFIDFMKTIDTHFSFPDIYFVSSTKNPKDIEKVAQIPEIKGFKTKFLEKEFFESLLE